MPFIPLHAVLLVALPLVQDAVIPPPARVPLPRPAAGAPVASTNQNLVGAGKRSRDTLTLALDVVEAAYQPEGADDPVVRILALAERGKTPQVPGPLLRVPAGTTGRRDGRYSRANAASVAPIASIVARAFHRSRPLKMNENASTSPFSAVT